MAENLVPTFFSFKGEAEDTTFSNIRDLNFSPFPEIRIQCLALWENFQPYADTKFLSQIQMHFDGGYWEMLLVNKIIEQNYSLSSKDYGPDICTFIGRTKLFIEAVCPNEGTGENEVVAISPSNTVQSLHEDPISLRLTSAIAQKNRVFQTYLNEGVVATNDMLVITINAGDVPDSHIEDPCCPIIAKLVYAIGDAVMTKNVESGEDIFNYQRREKILNANLSPIGTDLFIKSENSHISAILYSSENAFNSGPYYLLHNSKAKVPLPAGSILGVREFSLCLDGNSESLKWRDY